MVRRYGTDSEIQAWINYVITATYNYAFKVSLANFKCHLMIVSCNGVNKRYQSLRAVERVTLLRFLLLTNTRFRFLYFRISNS